MRMREAEHPFYRPLWVRLSLTGALLLWTALEWARNEPFWGIMTSAAAVWAIWSFFLTYDPDAAAKQATVETATREKDVAGDDIERSEGK